MEPINYDEILDRLNELYAEMAGFSKERKWAELKEDINEFEEWLLTGMDDDCPIKWDRWLSDPDSLEPTE